MGRATVQFFSQHMETSPVNIPLDDLGLQPGVQWERTFPLDLPPVTLGGERHQVLVRDGVRVLVERIAGGFLVRVSLTATVYGPCARCLREVPLDVEAEEEEFVPTAKDQWEESQFSEFIQDLVVDVNGMAREALILSLPSQIVCSSECKGLCARCGRDLNQEECACPPDEIDERWGRLKDLKLDD